MQNVAIQAPTGNLSSAIDPVDLAIEMLADGSQEGALAAAETMAGVGIDAGIEAGDERIHHIAIELAVALLSAFDEDFASRHALAIVDHMPMQIATIAAECVLMANFPDGAGDHAELPDATLLCLAALTHGAERTGEALAMLRDASEQRAADFEAAAYAMRCWMLGIGAGVAALWLGEPVNGENASIDALRAAAEDARALDPEAHRALGRALAEAGDHEAAANAFMLGLALPVGEDEKLAIGPDFAALTILLRSIGASSLLDAPRVRLALDACPKVTAHARAAIAGLTISGPFAAVHPDALADARSFFAFFDRPAPSPFPTRNGRPHVDIVWLEITNHCNQKCTFCPDMYREDARTWLPLDKVKALIDEMADTLSVGSMQLNAYGEPLLHPNIKEILEHMRARKLPFPTFFTSHGMTLVEKKLKQLSNNYPSGIAISLHNDGQESYAATRSAKIGDYETLVTRVTALLRQMVYEQAPSHLRLYQMVSNGHEDMQVDPKVRGAFPNTPERMAIHVRKWEAICADIVANIPLGGVAGVIHSSDEEIERCFRDASHGDGNQIPIMWWIDQNGGMQTAFMSPRPVGTYANLLLEYHDEWEVERKTINPRQCGFTASPSLAIFATGKLGICCLDMNSTATFASLSDHDSLAGALSSPEARRMFAQLSNGVATNRGCQICLGSGKQMCGTK